MLDAPFYCRSAVRTTVLGETAVGVHEALDLDRFASPWLKPMLALKVPRRRRWRESRGPQARLSRQTAKFSASGEADPDEVGDEEPAGDAVEPEEGERRRQHRAPTAP